MKEINDDAEADSEIDETEQYKRVIKQLYESQDEQEKQLEADLEKQKVSGEIFADKFLELKKQHQDDNLVARMFVEGIDKVSEGGARAIDNAGNAAEQAVERGAEKAGKAISKLEHQKEKRPEALEQEMRQAQEIEEVLGDIFGETQSQSMEPSKAENKEYVELDEKKKNGNLESPQPNQSRDESKNRESDKPAEFSQKISKMQESSEKIGATEGDPETHVNKNSLENPPLTDLESSQPNESLETTKLKEQSEEEKEIESKALKLVMDYNAQPGKVAIISSGRGGLKLSNKFMEHVKDNPSISEKEKKELIEYCEDSKCLRKLMYKELQEIVELRGDKLLSPKYVNARTKMRVECKEGHVRKSTPDNLKKGKGCGECWRKEEYARRIEEYKKKFERILEQKGGKLVSEYVNSQTKVWIECKKGHRWDPKPVTIVSGKYCGKCEREERGLRQRKETIKKVNRIIEQRGGKLQDASEYLSGEKPVKISKIWIECAEKHVWPATPEKIVKGTWCPECNTLRSERICRNIFEAIFKKEFQKVTPEWLVNDRGNQMELDGFNEGLGLAFEYQGEQHYHYRSLFHESVRDLEQRMADDQLKRELCEQNGITLIEIPYTVKYKDIPDYIITRCRERNIDVPNIDQSINFEEIINKAYQKGIKITEQSKIDEFVSVKDEEHEDKKKKRNNLI